MIDERYAEAVRQHQQGRLAEARLGYLEVLAEDSQHADAMHLLGVVDFQQGEPEGGARRIAAAIRLRPDEWRFHGNLGLALAASGRSRDALDAYDRALVLAPDFAEAIANRSVTLAELGRREEAVAGFERAASLRVGLPAVQASILAQLGVALTKLGDSAGAYDALDRSLTINPRSLPAAGARLFVLNYLSDVSTAYMVDEAKAFGTLAALQVKARTAHSNVPDPDRPLRIGIVSGDFKSSSISRFLDPLLQIDPKHYRLYAYYTRPRADEVTARLRLGLSSFRRIADLSDGEAAELIAEDGIDVLCDMSGHSSGNRMGLFARKPAPVQFTWLGYFATTGLRTMDYVLCNDVVVPLTEEWQWAERPWRMRSTYLCFSPPQDVIETSSVTTDRDRPVTFGSYNNFSKLTPETLALWRRVLDAVPGSRMRLRSSLAASEARLASIKASLGENRVSIEAPISDYRAHLRSYQDIDVALDPFPYAGGTTTCEALWMGVPVVTLRGDRYVAHMGESILRTIGRSDWIAADSAAYVAVSRDLAADVLALRASRGELRRQFATSPMCDTAGFARDFEQALRGMWRAWCIQNG